MMAFDDPSHTYAFKCVSAIRAANIPADLYPEPGKLKKQMKYASDLGCAYAGIIGETEMNNGTLMLKNLASGEQQEVKLDDAIRILKA